ncbi:uncharacterized protein LOC121620909 [Chelmon rostratus]|uniref:uncharacterized protein LOC121620909 n=1 Tax=Chelmon rostratus TaxID=109905 RepID=UPI001BE4FD40|nr:uncharacterized protein LOC121620909 [Chelmon rostratus]
MIFKINQSLIFLVFCIGGSLGCKQRNISCEDIKTPDGFKYLHDPLCNFSNEGSEISVEDNEHTMMARLDHQSLEHVAEVRSMDKNSVITSHCQDLHVTCVISDGKGSVEDFCFNYIITGKGEMMPSGSSTPWALIIGVSFAVALIAVAGFVGVLWYKKQLRAATHKFSSLLAVRPGIFQTREEEAGLGGIQSASVSHRSGENVTEQDDTLESVLVDSTADDNPAQSLSLDHNLCNEEIQPSENGDTVAPDVNRATNHRAMHRNLGDDPGGVNDNKGKDIPREMHNGWNVGDCGEDHEDEGRALLFSQRAAIQSSDMTGEAAVLVNKRDFEPDQVSRCSTAPDTDVESASNKY